MTLLKRAQQWQTQLDKAEAQYLHSDDYTYIVYNTKTAKHEIYLQGVTHATCIGSGTLEGCQRVASKIKAHPQFIKNYRLQ